MRFRTSNERHEWEQRQPPTRAEREEWKAPIPDVLSSYKTGLCPRCKEYVVVEPDEVCPMCFGPVDIP